MSTLFSFLTQLEVTQFQAVDRWMYKRGVERVQVKLRMANPIIFLDYTYQVTNFEQTILSKYCQWRNTELHFVKVDEET